MGITAKISTDPSEYGNSISNAAGEKIARAIAAAVRGQFPRVTVVCVPEPSDVTFDSRNTKEMIDESERVEDWIAQNWLRIAHDTIN